MVLVDKEVYLLVKGLSEMPPKPFKSLSHSKRITRLDEISKKENKIINETEKKIKELEKKARKKIKDLSSGKINSRISSHRRRNRGFLS